MGGCQSSHSYPPPGGMRKQEACSLTLITVFSLSGGRGGELTLAPMCHCTPTAKSKLEHTGDLGNNHSYTNCAWTCTGHRPRQTCAEFCSGLFLVMPLVVTEPF